MRTLSRHYCYARLNIFVIYFIWWYWCYILKLRRLSIGPICSDVYKHEEIDLCRWIVLKKCGILWMDVSIYSIVYSAIVCIVFGILIDLSVQCIWSRVMVSNCEGRMALYPQSCSEWPLCSNVFVFREHLRAPAALVKRTDQVLLL